MLRRELNILIETINIHGEKGFMRRCAIYVIYDKDAIIDRYVGYFIKQLKTCVQDIYIVINFEHIKKGKHYLEGVTDIFYRKNVGYDVGAFKDAILNLIGIEQIRKYDELLMINDSFYGPFIEFNNIFNKMDNVVCDFWGASKHGKYIEKSYKIEEHLQSFFLCVRNKILVSDYFFRYWVDMPMIKNYNDAIRYHETVFTQYFVNKGYKYSCLSNTNVNDSENVKYNYCQYAYIQYELIKYRNFPFLKRRPIALDYIDMQTQENWKKALDYIDKHTNYDVDMIYENLVRTQNHVDLFEKLCLQYVLQNNKKDIVFLDKAIIIVYVKYKSAVYFVLEYLNKIKYSVKIILVALEKDIYEIYSKNGYKVYMKKDIYKYAIKYEYICIIQDDELLDSRNFSCTKKSALYSIWENLISSTGYIMNICNVFEKNKWIGVLTVPDMIHAGYFCKTWNDWVGVRQGISELISKNKINVYFSLDSKPIVNSTNIWIRRSVLKKLHDYKFKKKYVGYMVSYIAQSMGLLSGICETADFAALNQINQQNYLNSIIKQEFRQENKINAFSDIQKDITFYKVREFEKKHNCIYVYGAGKVARDYQDIIKNCQGYIISDGMIKTDKNQLYLSQLQPYENVGIIICMNDENQRCVIPMLVKRGFNYLCV